MCSGGHTSNLHSLHRHTWWYTTSPPHRHSVGVAVTVVGRHRCARGHASGTQAGHQSGRRGSSLVTATSYADPSLLPVCLRERLCRSALYGRPVLPIDSTELWSLDGRSGWTLDRYRLVATFRLVAGSSSAALRWAPGTRDRGYDRYGRWHVAIRDTYGVARQSKPHSHFWEAVRFAEGRVRAETGPDEPERARPAPGM
jgi:hypothetical protein